jgi:hypothetical protein
MMQVNLISPCEEFTVFQAACCLANQVFLLRFILCGMQLTVNGWPTIIDHKMKQLAIADCLCIVDVLKFLGIKYNCSCQA